MSKIWGYVRVSTRGQKEDRQVEAIKPFVTSEAHIIIEKMSGKDFKRPQYLWLKQIMDEGDTLVIKSLDRLGRNYSMIKDEWKELSDKGIKIKVIDTPMLDTSKYEKDNLMAQFTANLVFEVLSFVSENERRNINQRQREGVAIAKAKGVKFGRKPVEPDNWDYVYSRWKAGKITATQAVKELSVSRSTFYKKVRDIEKKKSA